MLDRSQVFHFETAASQFVQILEPLARACKCLESSKSTVSDVYVFWLGVLATYENLFCRNDDQLSGLRLPSEVLESIRQIVNARWSEFIDGSGQTIYLAGLFLDPRFSLNLMVYPVLIID